MNAFSRSYSLFVSQLRSIEERRLLSPLSNGWWENFKSKGSRGETGARFFSLRTGVYKFERGYFNFFSFYVLSFFFSYPPNQSHLENITNSHGQENVILHWNVAQIQPIRFSAESESSGLKIATGTWVTSSKTNGERKKRIYFVCPMSCRLSAVLTTCYMTLDLVIFQFLLCQKYLWSYAIRNLRIPALPSLCV